MQAAPAAASEDIEVRGYGDWGWGRGWGALGLGTGTERGCSGEQQRGLRRRGGVEEGSAYSRSPSRARWPDRVLVRMEALCGSLQTEALLASLV